MGVAESVEKSTLVAIIRLRGEVGTPHDVEYSLRLLRLVKKHCCVVYPMSKSLQGVLNRVKDWVTWGEIDLDTLTALLKKRGRVEGGKPLTDEFVRKSLNIESIEELAKGVYEGRLKLHKLKEFGVKPVFRLRPPKGGFKGSIRKPYKDGGEVGYRGNRINDLLKRMI
ncbi:MAG: 50S ribosomal protein L30 [Ignisphaera sp.]|nr:50S ribosomal protein L30 [Ignisphaera sp.]MCX8168501.1 50S ribosomal protein L30 [Ignisphaera sp.]MDW8085059.1 50S ribosomal protein L30 [Ignisphaera sp.]